MILDKYILFSFLKNLILIIIVIIVLFYCIDFFENARYFSKYSAKIVVILEYYLIKTPKLIYNFISFSSFLSTIITLMILARNGEISAIRSSGRSLKRITFPIVILGIFISLFSLVLNEYVVPVSEMHLKYLEQVKIKKLAYNSILLESKWVRGNGGILHFDKYNPFDKVIYFPQYYEFSSYSSIKIFAYANEAYFDVQNKKWILSKAVISHFSTDGKLINTELAKDFLTTVNSEPPRILRDGINSEQLSYIELKKLINLSKRAGGNLSAREVDLHWKLSMPFASLVFIFLALPFSVTNERKKETFLGILISLIMLILYWFLSSLMQNIGDNIIILPIFSAWIINIVFCVISFILIHRLDRGV